MTPMPRVPLNPNILITSNEDRRGLENFWTYDAPLMALNNPHVLNAILALASVQYANSPEGRGADSKEFNSMTYYHNAVRGLREDIMLQRFPNSLAALTTSLLLAFFETMDGDLVKWFLHMSGARDIIVALDIGSIAAGAQRVYANGVPSNLSPHDISAVQVCDLLNSYLHMELMQSVIGRSKLLLPLEFWDQVPCRHGKNPRLFAYDLLLRHTARLCRFVAIDAVRKEKLYGPVPGSPAPPIPSQNAPSPVSPDEEHDLDTARVEWESIRGSLLDYQTQFAAFLTPLPPQGPPIMSPFGPHYTYASSYDHFLVCFLNMSWLILIRNNPDVPAQGYQTLRFTAQEGVPYMLNILRSLPPTVPYNIGHIGEENLNDGQVVRLVIDSCVPIFFAAVQVREPHQQDWIMNWIDACHKYTGWSTCERIQLGIKKAWTFQKAAIAEMSPSARSTVFSPLTSLASPITSPQPSSSRQNSIGENTPSSTHSQLSPGPSEGDTPEDKGKQILNARGLLH